MYPEDEETDVDELGSLEAPPVAAHAIVLPEQRIEGERPRAATPAPTPIDHLLSLLGEGYDYLANPSAGSEQPEPWSGGEQPTDLGTAIPDAVRSASHSSGLDALIARLGDFGSLGPTEDTHAERVSRLADATRRAEERSPTAASLGSAAGVVAPMLIPGPQEAEGASLLAQLGRAGAEGAGYMGLTSEAETPEGVAADMGVGTAGGALVRGGTRALGAAGGAIGRELERQGSRADMARLSSVLGERSAPISSREMQEMIRTLGAGAPREQRVAAAAQRVRDTGVVRPFSTVDDVLSRTRARLPEAEARTAAIRGDFDASGGRVPVQELPRALEQAASEMERDPALAEHAARVRQQAERSSDVLMRLMGDDATVSLADAERALEPIRTRAGYRSITDVPSAQEAWRDALRAGRRGIDDVVASGLGGDTARAFPAARRDVQTLRLLETLAEQRAGRAAMRSPLASTVGPMIAGMLGGGATAGAHGAAGGLGAGAALALPAVYRAARAREASMLATGLEAVQRLVQSGAGEALGRYAPILERASRRGSLPVVHRLLMQSDPEYAATVEGVSQEPTEEAPEERPFDPSELEERPFDPAELE